MTVWERPWLPGSVAEAQARRVRQASSADEDHDFVCGLFGTAVEHDLNEKPRADEFDLAAHEWRDYDMAELAGGKDDERPGIRVNEECLWRGDTVNAMLSSPERSEVKPGWSVIGRGGEPLADDASVDGPRPLMWEKKYGSAPYADDPSRRVLIVPEWRTDFRDGKEIKRNPFPPEWCAVWSGDGCQNPLPLKWPEPCCEFPGHPFVWGDDRRCHCNGCLTYPRGHNAKYCSSACKDEMDNARRRENRRRQGKSSRRNGESVLRTAADRRARYSADMKDRAQQRKQIGLMGPSTQ